MKAPNDLRGLYCMQNQLLRPCQAPTTALQDRLSFPVPLTSFVGREQEITTLCTLLSRPEIRLLTLTGTGGVGKTRLALQVATRLGQDFSQPVGFVSLTDISNPELVIPTIAEALGLQELGSRPILEHVQAFLKDKCLLLLLDNLEQVLDAGLDLLALLESCPGLKILATSRALLRLSGEYPFVVPPLPLPDLAQLSDEEDLLHYPAISLFVQRARAVLPDFDLMEENRRTIAEICLHLDGLPLAIELVVPRLKVLSPHMLLERLAHRFEVLTQGMRDAPGRHQTLQKTLEWSYRLLMPREQHLFRFLSVFVGGCSLQALEAAWTLAGYQQEPNQILEAVISLLEKSMLSRDTQEAREPRLFLLRTLREYGWRRLILVGEQEQVQWAHATYYLRLAEEAEPQLKGPRPRRWLERLQREHENLREALSFLIAHGEHDTNKGTQMALRLGRALERFWIIGGHVKEGRDLLEQALKNCSGEISSLRGQALCILSTLARYQGDFSAATRACEESLALFRELDDPVGLANALYRSGSLAWMRGDTETARTSYEESLQITQGDACKDARSEMLYWFAYQAFFQHEAPQARQMIEESLSLSRELEDQYNIATALNLLGWVSLLQEDIPAARRFQEESLRTSQDLGNQRGVAHTLSALGEIAYRMGDFPQACERYEESLAIILRIDDRWILPIYLEGLARAAVAQGEAMWAASLLSAAQALRESLGTSMTELEKLAHEHTLSALHALLEEHVLADAWEKGRAMSPEQAVAARTRSRQATAPSPEEKPPMMNGLSARSLPDEVTPREREVLRLVAQGLTDAQIAQSLVISPRTVNFHLGSIYRKLEVSSRSAATRYALECRLF